MAPHWAGGTLVQILIHCGRRRSYGTTSERTSFPVNHTVHTCHLPEYWLAGTSSRESTAMFTNYHMTIMFAEAYSHIRKDENITNNNYEEKDE